MIKENLERILSFTDVEEDLELENNLSASTTLKRDRVEEVANALNELPMLINIIYYYNQNE